MCLNVRIGRISKAETSAKVRMYLFFTSRARQDTHSAHCSVFIPTLTENVLITNHPI